MSLEINQRVKTEQIRKGYTQEKMAFALNLKETTYSQMERTGKIGAETLIEIADVLNVDILDLLYGNYLPSQQSEEAGEYTTQEKSIITIIRNLAVKDRNDVIKYVELKYKAQKNR